MDPAGVLREIGGGLAGVVMVVQFLVIARKRNEVLTQFGTPLVVSIGVPLEGPA